LATEQSLTAASYLSPILQSGSESA